MLEAVAALAVLAPAERGQHAGRIAGETRQPLTLCHAGAFRKLGGDRVERMQGRPHRCVVATQVVVQLVDQDRQPPPVDEYVVGGHQDRTRLPCFQQHPGEPGRIPLGIDRAGGQCRCGGLQGGGIGSGDVDVIDRQRGPVRAVDVLYGTERVDGAAQRLVAGGEGRECRVHVGDGCRGRDVAVVGERCRVHPPR